jgi:hypothetical protein
VNKRQFRDALQTRNGIVTPGDGLAAFDAIDAAVASALLDISAEQRWPWLLTSTSLTFSTSTGAASMPANCGTINQLVVGGYPATYADPETYLSQTVPYVWTTIGTELRLFPIPTSVPTATLYYWRDEPALAADLDTPLLPAAWHQIAIARASYHLNIRRNDTARAAADLNEYREGLKNLMQSTWRGTGPRKLKSAFRATMTGRW